MSDQFASHTPGLSSPAVDLLEIIADDVADLDPPVRALEVQGAGDVHLVTHDGQEITKAFLVGLWPVRVKKVFSTGTTATGLWGYV